MDISELYDYLLENNVELHLIGDITCDSESIKWEYDGLGKSDEDMQAHLEETFDTDKEIIVDFLTEEDLLEMFFIHEPEINDSYITFLISEE